MMIHDCCLCTCDIIEETTIYSVDTLENFTLEKHKLIFNSCTGLGLGFVLEYKCFTWLIRLEMIKIRLVLSKFSGYKVTCTYLLLQSLFETTENKN